jgi:hypothetical protein
MTARFTLDRDRRVVFGERKMRALGRREAEMLQVLASRPGQCMHKEWIIRGMYGADNDATVKTIDVVLCRVRQRLARGGIDLALVGYRGSGLCPGEPIRVGPAPPTHGVIIRASALPILRELLRRCSDRPADAALAEQAWQQFKEAQPVVEPA